MRGSFCNLLRLLLQLLISGRVSGCSCYSGRRARPGVCCRLLSAHSELGRYRPGRSGVQPLGHNSRGGATRQRTHRQRSFRFRQPVPTLNGTVGRLRTHRHSLDPEECHSHTPRPSHPSSCCPGSISSSLSAADPASPCGRRCRASCRSSPCAAPCGPWPDYRPRGGCAQNAPTDSLHHPSGRKYMFNASPTRTETHCALLKKISCNCIYLQKFPHLLPNNQC